MIKLTLAAVMVLAATSIVAQDTPEQQAAKCEAEGGCAIFSRDEIVQLMQLAYKKGLRACNSNI